MPTPQDHTHPPSSRVFDRLSKDACDRSETRRRLEILQSLQTTHIKAKSTDIKHSSEVGFTKSKPESRHTESVETRADEENRGKLDKKRTKELVDRLNGEAAKRQLKLEQARRDREEQMLEEAYRLANTRHTNKESLKKLKSHEAKTIAKMYKQPESTPVPRPSSTDQKVFSVSQAKASGCRLMQRPTKAVPQSEPQREKLTKDKTEKVVSRLYPKGKTLSASNSGVKFYVPTSDDNRTLRTLSAVRTRPSTQRPPSHLSPQSSQSPEVPTCPRRQAIQLRPRPYAPSPTSWEKQSDTTPEPLQHVALPCRPDPVWYEEDRKAPYAAVTPQPTTKDSNDTPARPSKDQSDVDSPNVSSISHHYEDDSFTRLTAFPEPKPTPLERPISESTHGKVDRPWSPKLKLPLKSFDTAGRTSQKTTERTSEPFYSPTSPQYSEEALYLMRNPIKSFMESIKSPTATAQPPAPMSAYRFVVGLNESDEFIYQDDKP